MQEQRISVRTNLLDVHVKISTDGQNWTDVVALDISDGGLGFVSDAEFPKGTKFMMQGAVSDHVKHMNVNCECKVIFSASHSDDKTMHGVKFLDISRVQRTALSIFIEQMVTKYPSLLIE